MKDVTTDTDGDLEVDGGRTDIGGGRADVDGGRADSPEEDAIEEDIIEIKIEQPQFKPMSLTSSVLR